MARQLPCNILVLVALAVTASFLTAPAEAGRLLGAKAGAAAATEGVESTGRELWINPNSKPTSTKGYDVIISIICQGKYSTVNSVKLRSALQSLGFASDSYNMSFGGNAATTNWRSITTFVVNIPTATSTSGAIKAVSANVTVKALNKLAKLPSVNPVLDVYFSGFKA